MLIFVLIKKFIFYKNFVTFINFQKMDFLRFSRAKPHKKFFCHKSWLLKKVGHFLDFLQKIGARVRFSDFFLSKCVIIVFTSGKKVAKKYILGVPKLGFFAFFPGQTTKIFFTLCDFKNFLGNKFWKNFLKKMDLAKFTFLKNVNLCTYQNFFYFYKFL